MVGETCLTKATSAPCGVHRRSATLFVSFVMARSIMAVKSAARPSGSRTMSTVPSSAEAMRRSSPTSQSVPTPRQSHWKRPSQRSSTASRCSGVSPSFWPSVSRIAWWIASGAVLNSSAASESHVPMAVPSLGHSSSIASLASLRVCDDATASGTALG